MNTREESCGVNQSISVFFFFFFFLKPRSVFSKLRRPFEREKSPLNTRRTNLLLERRLMIFARRNGRLNKRRSSRERTKTKDGNFFRSFLLSNRSGGRLDGQTARDDVSGENCIVVGEDDASARINEMKRYDLKSPLTRLACRTSTRLPSSCSTLGNPWYPCPRGG